MCAQEWCVNDTNIVKGMAGNQELFMRTDVDGEKLFLCLKVVVAAIGPPNIVTVWCIYCSTQNTHFLPWGINKVYSILFYPI